MVLPVLLLLLGDKSGTVSRCRRLGAKKSQQVTSKAKGLPLGQGIKVSPSGRRWSERKRPTGSMRHGSPDEWRARAMRSLMRSCRGKRPFDFEHERPWVSFGGNAGSAVDAEVRRYDACSEAKADRNPNLLVGKKRGKIVFLLFCGKIV